MRTTGRVRRSRAEQHDAARQTQHSAQTNATDEMKNCSQAACSDAAEVAAAAVATNASLFACCSPSFIRHEHQVSVDILNIALHTWARAHTDETSSERTAAVAAAAAAAPHPRRLSVVPVYLIERERLLALDLDELECHGRR